MGKGKDLGLTHHERQFGGDTETCRNFMVLKFRPTLTTFNTKAQLVVFCPADQRHIDKTGHQQVDTQRTERGVERPGSHKRIMFNRVYQTTVNQPAKPQPGNDR